VVGVIDSGIDFTHPDFSTESGTRIQHLLEITPNGFLEWSKQQIDSTPQIVTQRDLDDGFGHGTHVTGTAAGGGRLNPSLTGMAPEADIIFVKGMIESSFSDNSVINGCQFIFTRAAQSGKPAVINMSLGGLSGPLDGTSLYEQALSNMTGPGRIIVATTGNEGFSFRHAGANIQSGNRHATMLMPHNGSFSAANIWHKPGVISQVAVGAFVVDQAGSFEYLGNTQFIAAGFSMNQVPLVHNEFTLGYVSIDARTTADPRNGDGNIFVAIEGNENLNVDIRNVVWVLIYDSGAAGRFDMWSFSGEFWPSLTGIQGAIEIPGDVLQTTGAPSTANKIISVGSFVSTNSWTDIDNQSRQWTNPDPTRQSENQVVPTIGQMSYFSSIGPTRDGRTAPDVSGPGELIFSALSSTLTPGVGLQRHMVLHSGGYQGMQGTSMAAPHVTGLVALMLEINPGLDYEDVVGILKQTARSDEFTGSLPNQKAGYGKLDAHAAVLLTLELSGAGTPPSTSLSYFDPEEEADFLTLDSFLPVDSGFVFGTNRYFDTAKATAFTLPDGNTTGTVTEVNIWFGYKKDGLTNESYSIDIYNGNKESGPIGQPLASQNYLIKDIDTGSNFNFDAGNVTKHVFSEPVTVGAEFIVAINFGTYGATGIGNTGIIGTKAVGQRVPEVWERWNNGSWHNMSDAWFGQSSAPGTGTNGWYMWKEVGLSTSVSVPREIADLPGEFRLDQNFPNPFNPATSIRYSLKESTEITLAVYDLLGRQVALLENGFREAGEHITRFHAFNLSSGIYFYRLTDGSNSEIRKMMLMK
jgi:subtilisin family serine protease